MESQRHRPAMSIGNIYNSFITFVKIPLYKPDSLRYDISVSTRKCGVLTLIVYFERKIEIK